MKPVKPVDPPVNERLDLLLMRLLEPVDTRRGFDEHLARKLVSIDPGTAATTEVATTSCARLLKFCARHFHLVPILMLLVTVTHASWPVLQTLIARAQSGTLAASPADLGRALAAVFATLVAALVFTSPGTRLRRLPTPGDSRRVS